MLECLAQFGGPIVDARFELLVHARQIELKLLQMHVCRGVPAAMASRNQEVKSASRSGWRSDPLKIVRATIYMSGRYFA